MTGDLMSNGYLSLRGISKRYGKQTALNGIDLDIRKNEFVCLLGPSGCGKSTLLRIIAGLERTDAGRMTLAGRDLTPLPPAKRNFGMMFQSYALFPNMSAADNIAYGLKGRMPKRDIADKVSELLVMMDLQAARDKLPSQLSGGQQQRVALARALALSPDCLLLDEPLSALDAKVRSKLRREIRQLHERFGMTTIMVTHDQEEALTMADRIVVMNHAQVVQVGTPQDVYERPNSPFVADFIGAVSFVPAARSGIAPVAGERGAAPGLLAIRPEHVRVLGAEAQPVPATQGAGAAQLQRGIVAVVRDMEYRGSFYRIVLDASGDARAAEGQSSITVDLPAPTAERLKLRKNDKLALDLPPERVIRFGSDEEVSA